MKCENCQQEHNGEYGSGRFCSVKCARGFSTKANRKEISEKVSKCLSGRKIGTWTWKDYNLKYKKTRNNVKYVCKNCNKIFEDYPSSKRIFCSRKCQASHNGKKRCENLKEKCRLRDIGRKGGFGKKGKTKFGRNFYSKLEETCFDWLDENNIQFIAHKCLPNSSKISDVYLEHFDIWIELDGINREKKKDYFKNGYIYWKNKLEEYCKLNLVFVVVYSLDELKYICYELLGT